MRSIIFVLGLMLITLSCFTCSMALHSHYCKSLSHQSNRFNIYLDSVNNSFSFSLKGGFWNDTLKGNYLIRGNKLKLKLYNGRSYLREEQGTSDSIRIQFINSKYHNPIPFILVNVRDVGQIETSESGRVSFAVDRDQYFIQISKSNYEDFETILNNKGDWIIELVPKVSLNENLLKWKIKKGAIKSKHLELEKCS